MSFECGWYYVDEVWNLYLDVEDGVDDTHRRLQEVHVEFVCVDDHPDDRDDGYNVKHYDRSGDLITTLSLDSDDLQDVLGDKETTDRPMYI